jgi:RNA polymerase sigma factor (TIGR02999 family)
LANEVFLKVFGKTPQDFRDRQHFFRLVAKAIRQILINYAEERGASKRGGKVDHVPLEEAFGFGVSDKLADQICDLHLALEQFERVDPRAAEVVQLKFFVGLRNEEIAEVLEVSRATVARDWTLARAWLWREMDGSGLGELES